MGVKAMGVGREFQAPEELLAKHPVARGSLCGKGCPFL